MELKKIEYTYENYLKEIGVTHEQILAYMENYYVVYMNTDIIIKDSTIEGLGCFSSRSYQPEEKIGDLLAPVLLSPPEGNSRYIRTELGRYVNHSSTPNVYFEKGAFIALKHIPPDTELVTNYFHNVEAIKKEAL
tara:strand:- start:51 stop:455 length:405 start_codon:yes stop_codon:yes gene_type:complete